jgi:thymidine phosphorylase
MLGAQGADLNEFNQRLERDHTAAAIVEIKAASNGFISGCNARVIGEVVRDLGGGRITKEAEINHEVGIDKLKKPGEAVSRGALLARVHAVDAQQAEMAAKRIKEAFAVSSRKQKGTPLVAEVVAKK